MGKVIKMLHKIKEKSDIELLSRLEHILVAKAVHDYLGDAEDPDIMIEIRLSKEEVLNRMAHMGNGVKISLL